MMSSLPEQTTPERVGGDTISIQPGSKTADRVRLFFLDHLRAALTILVVLHHLAVVYSATSPFYFVEPPAPQDHLYGLLIVFLLLNQAYFMGFFFLISGYFTPSSFDRKGPGTYYKDRLLRLGIPLLAYVFVLSPIASIGLYQAPTDYAHLTPPFSWQQIHDLLGVGPLWFAEMLLFFCLGYVIWRWLVPARVQPVERVSNPPSYLAVGIFIPVLALASYLIRIVVPMGTTVPIFGFPSFAYFAQYLSFFILGIIAFRRNWFQTIPGSMGVVGLVAALVATIVLGPLALSNGAAFVGHGTWQSAVYALWDSIFAVGICLALLTFFRRFLNRQTGFGRFLSRQAFTVYIIHIPIIVLLALALHGIHLESLPKFALTALIGVPLCFSLAFLVRKIPFASRVL
ncbi:MAG TPA: acyltransferase family protein [Ktedonobacteraceae bacterium]|nr:acyltransferase family protein [Ktedonobacteraceae bacterium]